MNKTSKHKQQGLTMISWVIVIVFLLFQGVIAMNILPVYITDSSVKSILANLPTDSAAREASAKDLKLLVIKRLSMNNVYTVKPESVTVKKERDALVVKVEYEPRGKLIGNLEYIVDFKHEARVHSR